MADALIFTALNIPTPPPHPSITCAQWSGDGQLIVSTKSAIFILTPDLGINFDNLSLLKTDRRNLQERSNKDIGLDLGWHKNLIELDRTVVQTWNAESQELGAVNIGSLDVSWRAVAVSPGNISSLTTGSGSMLVVMSTNLELTLWCATKNHLKEAWTKTQDITSTLRELPSPQEGEPHDRCLYLKVLQAQVNCMAWSEQANFGAHPNPLVDGSILALGNRTGSIILMRYDGKQGVESMRVVHVANEWVIHLAWGPWRSSQPFQSEAYLACGISNGSIIIVRVRQHLEVVSSTTPFGSSFVIHHEVSVLDAPASNADNKGITALAWIDRAEEARKPTLFHAKAGLFRFYQVDYLHTEAGKIEPCGKELAVLRVQLQKTSVDSSPLYPVSGLSRITNMESDVLLVTLLDSSFHVVLDIFSAPKFRDMDALSDDAEATAGNYNSAKLTSLNVSRLARSAFVNAEGGALRHTDVGRISSAVGFDNLGAVIWLHEACRPTDFTYKHEAKHNCMIVAARLWRPPNEHEILLRHIRETFQHPSSGLGIAPASKLRPILLHICQRQTFEAIAPGVLELLPNSPQYIEPISVMAPWSGEVDDEIRLAFRRSLAVDLYGWDAFDSLRLRLAVADYCWKMSATKEMREQFGRAAQGLLSSISHRFMKVVVKHLTAIVGSLNEQDLPFLMRIIVQGLLEGSPPDLSALAQALNEVAKMKFDGVPPEAFGLTETCPACRSPIPLNDLLTAVCPQGHTWARCSITSFVLATPMVRTCSGCTRKAFLAPSSRSSHHSTNSPPNVLNLATEGDAATASPSAPSGPNLSMLWIPEAGRSWIVDELLEAARCCIYCGNRFVRVL